jgi:hypothetical protein
MSFDDYAINIDENGAGEDEILNLEELDNFGGRYLLVVWQKGSISPSGKFKIHLINESAIAEAEFNLNKPDTLKFSKLTKPLPPNSGKWLIAGLIPIGKSKWEIESSTDEEFNKDIVKSDLPNPLINFLTIQKPDIQANQIYLRFTRTTLSGEARIEISDLKQVEPLTEGLNESIIFPPNRHFIILPVLSDLPLKDLSLKIEADEEIQIYGGIAPDGLRTVFSPFMLWGNPDIVPENAPTETKGIAVFWLRKILNEPLLFDVTLNLKTSVKYSNNPKKEFTAYPNPCKNYVNIKYDNYHPMNHTHIKIFNILGYEINQPIEESILGNTIYYKINMNSLPKGIYLYRIFTNSKILSGNIIKKE